jgi:hypothetical protein
MHNSIALDTVLLHIGSSGCLQGKASTAAAPSSRNKRSRSAAWGGVGDTETQQGSAKKPGTAAAAWPPRKRNSNQAPGTRDTPAAAAEEAEDVVVLDSDDDEELGGSAVVRRPPGSISQRLSTPSNRAGWGSLT